MNLARLSVSLAAVAVGNLRSAQTDPNRVLLIRPDHLGDLLFATPAIRFLRQSMPYTHLALMVGPWSQPVVAHNPNLNEVLVCEFPWFDRGPARGVGAYQALWTEADRLRKMQFGLAGVLRPDFAWGAMLVALAGIPRRLGYKMPDAALCLTRTLPLSSEAHAVQQNLRLAELICGYSATRFRPSLEFVIPKEASDWAERYLEGKELENSERLVVIQPGSGAPIKSWTAAGFAVVAVHLQRRYKAQIILTGSAAERTLAEAIADEMSEPPIIAAGETDLNQLAALLQRSAVVIGVDSGPLHLAVAVGTSTVHLFGPANPAVYGPWGPPERHLVVQATLPCVPCGNLVRPCPPSGVADCMQAITPEQVITAAEQLLRSVW
jgi:heptosyltransferase-2/heptosyltransferase-3